jgi:hypothetical protein
LLPSRLDCESVLRQLYVYIKGKKERLLIRMSPYFRPMTKIALMHL